MTEKELEALKNRTQRLEDIEAIKILKAKYAAVCDDRYNPEKMMKLFTEDAIWDGGKDFGVHKGQAAIKKFSEEVSKNLVFAVHYFLQPVITVHKNGTTASGKWYLWQACTLQDGTGVWISGLENDKYRKVNNEWLMSEMKLKLFFMTPYEQGWHKIKILK
ncbi:MAG: nuclear transport factor 2 family protein [Pseudomonadota bacterium]